MSVPEWVTLVFFTGIACFTLGLWAAGGLSGFLLRRNRWLADEVDRLNNEHERDRDPSDDWKR